MKQGCKDSEVCHCPERRVVLCDDAVKHNVDPIADEKSNLFIGLVAIGSGFLPPHHNTWTNT
jgi:hypothetical protein